MSGIEEVEGISTFTPFLREIGGLSGVRGTSVEASTLTDQLVIDLVTQDFAKFRGYMIDSAHPRQRHDPVSRYRIQFVHQQDDDLFVIPYEYKIMRFKDAWKQGDPRDRNVGTKFVLTASDLDDGSRVVYAAAAMFGPLYGSDSDLPTIQTDMIDPLPTPLYVYSTFNDPGTQEDSTTEVIRSYLENPFIMTR